MRALVEQQDYGHNDSEGRLEDNVHIAEESKHQLQVHVLQLDDLGLRDTVTTLLCHPQRLRHQFPCKSTLDLQSQLMKQPFGMLPEEDPQKLYNHKFNDEISVLSFLQVFFPHEVHKLTNQFRHQQIQRCKDEGDCYSCNDLSEVGEDEVKEELIFLFGVVEAFDPAEEGESRSAEGHTLMMREVRQAGAERTREMWEKQWRCRYRQIKLPSIGSLYIYYSRSFFGRHTATTQILETQTKIGNNSVAVDSLSSKEWINDKSAINSNRSLFLYLIYQLSYLSLKFSFLRSPAAYVDILRFCTIDYICMFQKKRRAVGVRSKYAKIPIKTKLAFLRKVIKEGFSIRDSSTLFAINYSTAKTLMRQFKAHPSPLDLDNLTDLPSPDHSDLKRCSYRQLPSQLQQKMQVSSSGTSAFYLQQASSIRRVQIVSSISC